MLVMFAIGLVLAIAFPPTIIVSAPPVFWVGVVLMAIPVVAGIASHGAILG